MQSSCGGKRKRKKTYNTRDSLVVTDPTTSLALTGLSMGERTGSRVFQWVWSYVLGYLVSSTYKDQSVVQTDEQKSKMYCRGEEKLLATEPPKYPLGWMNGHVMNQPGRPSAVRAICDQRPYDH